MTILQTYNFSVKIIDSEGRYGISNRTIVLRCPEPSPTPSVTPTTSLIPSPTPTPTSTVTPTPSSSAEVQMGELLLAGRWPNTGDVLVDYGIVSDTNVPSYSFDSLAVDAISPGPRIGASGNYNITELHSIEKVGNRLFVISSDWSYGQQFLHAYSLSEDGTQLTLTEKSANYAYNGLNSTGSGNRKRYLAKGQNDIFYVAGNGDNEWSTSAALSSSFTSGVYALRYLEETDDFERLGHWISAERMIRSKLAATGNEIFVLLTDTDSTKLYLKHLRYDEANKTIIPVDEVLLYSHTAFAVNYDTTSLQCSPNGLIVVHVRLNSGDTYVCKSIEYSDNGLEIVQDVPLMITAYSASNPFFTILTDDNYIFRHSAQYSQFFGSQYDKTTKTYSSAQSLTGPNGNRYTGPVVYSNTTKRLYLGYKNFYGNQEDNDSGVWQWDYATKTFTQLASTFDATDINSYFVDFKSYATAASPLIPLSPTPTPTPTQDLLLSLTPTPSVSNSGIQLSTYSEVVIHDNPKHYWTFDEHSVLTGTWWTMFYDVINHKPIATAKDSDQYMTMTDSIFVSGGKSISGPYLSFIDNPPLSNFETGNTHEIWFMPYHKRVSDEKSYLFYGADFDLIIDQTSSVTSLKLSYPIQNQYDWEMVTTNVSVDIDQWYHLVVSVGERGNEYIKVYLNGALVLQSDKKLFRSWFSSSMCAFPLQNGTWTGQSYNRLFHMFFDEYAIYDYPLEPYQIQKHYQKGLETLQYNYRRPNESEPFSTPIEETARTFVDMPKAISDDGTYLFYISQTTGYPTYNGSIVIRKRNSIDNTWSTIQTIPGLENFQWDTLKVSSDGSRFVAYGTNPSNSTSKVIHYKRENGLEEWSFVEEVDLSAYNVSKKNFKLSKNGNVLVFGDGSGVNTNLVHIFRLSGNAYTFENTITVPAGHVKYNLYVGINSSGNEIVVSSSTVDNKRCMISFRHTDNTWALHHDNIKFNNLEQHFGTGIKYGDNWYSISQNNADSIIITEDNQYLIVAIEVGGYIRYGYDRIYYPYIIGIFKHGQSGWEPHQILEFPLANQGESFHFYKNSETTNHRMMSVSDISCSSNRLAVATSYMYDSAGIKSPDDGTVFIYELENDSYQLKDIVNSTRVQSDFYLFGTTIELCDSGKLLFAVSSNEGYHTNTVNSDNRTNSPYAASSSWYTDNQRGFARSIILPQTYPNPLYDQMIIDEYSIGPTYLGNKLLRPIHHFRFLNDAQPSFDVIDNLQTQLVGSAVINQSGFLNGSLLISDSSDISGVYISDGIDLPPVSTIEFWIKPGVKTGDYRTIIGIDKTFSIQLDPDKNSISVWDSETKQRYYLKDNQEYKTGYFLDNFVLEENVWTHVLIKNHTSDVRPLATQSSDTKYNRLFAIFLNGFYAGEFMANPENKTLTYIGTNADGQNCPGEIAELVVYNYGIHNSLLIARYQKAVAAMALTPTPIPSITPTRTPTPTPVTPTPTRTPTPTPNAGVTPTPTPSVTRSITPTPTVTRTVTATPSITPTISITPSGTPTPTPTEQDRQTYFNAVMRAKPVAYWTFADRGTTYSDFIGNNNLSVQGRIAHSDGSVRNSAIKLVDRLHSSQVHNKLTLAQPIVVQDNFTVECWAYIYASDASSKDFRPIIADSSGSPISNALMIFYGTLSLRTIDTNTGISNAVVPHSQWNHLVVTVNAGTINYYVNGSLAGTSTASGSSLILDSVGHDNTFSLNGILDELAIYNRAISGSEVLEHYNYGVPTIIQPTPTVTPTTTRTPTPTPTMTRTVTPTPSVTPSVGTSPTPTPTVSPLIITTMDPLNTDPELTLTDNNLTVTLSAQGGNNQNTRATESKSTGKLYYEARINHSNGNSFFDFGMNGQSVIVQTPDYISENGTGFTVEFGEGWGEIYVNVFGAAQSWIAIPYEDPISDSYIYFAVDLDAGKAWFRFSQSAQWAGGGDPELGTSPTVEFDVPEPMVPSIGLAGDLVSVTFNFGASAFNGTVPTGFAAWG